MARLVPAIVLLVLAMEISAEQIDQINQACYDNRADYWDRFPFEKEIQELIRENYTPELGKHVLDIGSGNGNIAKWLKEDGFKVLCIDPSSEMVRRTRAKGLETRQLRIQDFDSKEQFAMVFAVLSLIHVPKREFPLQLEKIAAWIPRGGIFTLAMIEGNSEGIAETNSQYPRFFAKYSMEQLKYLTKDQFDLIKSYRIVAGGVGYLLLGLKKK